MRTTLVFSLLFASTSIALVAPAFADDPPAKPAFALMDNTGDGSKINLDVAAIIPTEHPDGALFRFGFLGQYVGPSGFGGYAGISASNLFPADPAVGPGVGDAELGGLFQHALGREFDLGIRVGLAFPLANQADGRLADLASTLVTRPADLATTLDASWLRLGISPTYHHGSAFLRADLGVDVPLFNAQGIPPIGHLNLGAGMGGNGVIATAEMQTVFTSDQGSDRKDFHSYSTAGLSVRYQGQQLSPYVMFSTPLEDGLRGNVVTATAGLTFPF